MTRRYTGNFDSDNNKYKDLLTKKPASESGSGGGSQNAIMGAAAQGGSTEKQFGGGKKPKASEIIKAKLMGRPVPTQEKKDYQTIIKERLQAIMQEKLSKASSMSGAFLSNAKMGGMSEGGMDVMKKFFAKRKAQQEKNEKTKIQPINLRNGKVDTFGRIHTLGGRKVGFIDPKKGVICNNMGFKVANYDPKSFTCIQEMERMIDTFRANNRAVRPISGDSSGGSLWGGGGSGQGSGSSWNSALWGDGKDKKDGW